MSPDELLGRIAGALRDTVGPEVGDEQAKTQAYMAAVVLEKLAGQLRTAAAHRRSDEGDGSRLEADVVALVGDDPPPAVGAALADAGWGATGPGLGRVVAALYAERDALGPERFGATLDRVRVTLRARLDRELEFSA